MNVKDTIMNRRSVRNFTDQPVGQDVLAELMSAGIWSPSGGNSQPWFFIAVTNPQTLKLIKAVSPGLLGNPASYIAVCSDKKRNIEKMGAVGEVLATMDCAMAAQNIMLRACELGVGSCVIRSFNQKAVGEILKTPEGVEPELLITLGYADGKQGSSKRRDDVIFWEQYGGEE